MPTIDERNSHWLSNGKCSNWYASIGTLHNLLGIAASRCWQLIVEHCQSDDSERLVIYMETRRNWLRFAWKVTIEHVLQYFNFLTSSSVTRELHNRKGNEASNELLQNVLLNLTNALWYVRKEEQQEKSVPPVSSKQDSSLCKSARSFLSYVYGNKLLNLAADRRNVSCMHPEFGLPWSPVKRNTRDFEDLASISR